MQNELTTIPQPRQGSQDYIDRTFGPGGYLAKIKPGYIPREGQIAFARAVDRCFRENTPLLGQAPCGTGKGLSYLVPAIFHAISKKKRVIIATATNSLLDQLAKGPDCELAVLQRALPVKFTYATLKGKANYVCYRKLEGFEPTLQLEQNKDPARRLLLWAEKTPSGDRGEAPEMDARLLWHKISCGPEDCTKPSCVYSDRIDNSQLCLSEKAKDISKTVDVVVTNIHYLITHLKHGSCLPEADFFVLDEGHELPDITREFWGGEEREKSFEQIVAYAYAAERSELVPKGTGVTINKEVNQLFLFLKNFTNDPVKTAMKKQQDYHREKLLSGAIKYDLKALSDAMKTTAKVAKIVLDEGEKKQHISVEGEGEAQVFRNHFMKVWEFLEHLREPKADVARWVVVNGDDVFVKYAPIDVGSILRKVLFTDHPRTVIASATLQTGGSFDFIKREIGLERPLTIDGETRSALELDVPSPFNHREQCLFLVPKDARDPSSEYKEWLDHVFKTLRRVIELCNGRTLGLFTSKKAMEEAGAWLRSLETKRTILVQGESSPRELAKKFKEEKESVLLGTRSFWTGLDVPGESLTAVVIDKLPVPQQDPLMQAIKNKMGGAYFNRYLFPKAAITFQQGCGRPIRSVTDVGVIVLCDPRLTTKDYGYHFTKSLPVMEECNDIERIPEFLIASRAYVDLKYPPRSSRQK